MYSINIQSNTYAYVIIKGFILTPFSSGILEDNGLLKSEYKSLKNLADSGKILISDIDYTYLLGKVSETDTPTNTIDTYTKEQIDLALSRKASNTLASTSINGLMSKEDKTKLDELENIEIIQLRQEDYDNLPEVEKLKDNILYLIVE